MHRHLNSLAAILAVITLLPAAAPSWADQEQSVVDQETLDRAIAAKVDSEDGSRDAIRSLLQRPEVRELAEGIGVDVKRANGAVATLSPEDAVFWGSLADGIDTQLAGGQVSPGSSTPMGGGTGGNFPILYLLLIVALLVALIFLV